MSMMGELNYFLRLQIKQSKEGIFINQAKYIKDLLKKFGMKDAKTLCTSMNTLTKLDKDETINNEMVNSNKKEEDYNEVSYAHSFLNDNFEDHSNLYYDDDVDDDHMPYDELLDAFEE